MEKYTVDIFYDDDTWYSSEADKVLKLTHTLYILQLRKAYWKSKSSNYYIDKTIYFCILT